MSVIIKDRLINKNQTTKTEGGKSMKKMVKNNKGFSLIELLIVVAILAILAAISINLFGGVLNRQKLKSDEAACSYLQTAIQSYIAESDDSNLSGLGCTKTNAASDYAAAVAALVTNTISYGGTTYGPYLNNGTPTVRGPGHGGFDVEINTSTQTVTVTPNGASNGIHFTS